MAQLFELAKSPDFRDDIFASHFNRMTSSQFDKTESDVVLTWFDNDELKQRLLSQLASILLINQNNIEFTKTVINKLSDKEKIDILFNDKIDSDFINNNLELFTFNQKNKSDKIIRSKVIQSELCREKLLKGLTGPANSRVLEILTNDNYELLLSLLNINGFYDQLTSQHPLSQEVSTLFNNNTFVELLTQESNQQAVLNIYQSKNSDLIAAFWTACDKRPKLVAQVIEKLLAEDTSNITPHLSVLSRFIKSYPKCASFSSSPIALQKLASLGDDTINKIILPLLPSDESSRKDNIMIDIIQQCKHIEEIYQLLHTHQNNPETVRTIFTTLANINLDLLVKAKNSARLTQTGISTLFTKMDSWIANLIENQNRTNTIIINSKNKIENVVSGSESSGIEKYLALQEEYRNKRHKERNELITLSQKSNITIAHKEAEKYLKNIKASIQDNQLDKNPPIGYSRTVLVAYEEKLAQFQYLNLESNKIKFQAGTTSLRNNFYATQNDVNDAMRVVLNQASKYLSEGKNFLAEKYYQAAYKSFFHHKEVTDEMIGLESSIFLIDVLILQRSNEATAKEDAQIIFSNLFNTNFYKIDSIKKNIKAFPIAWLSSLNIFNTLQDALSKEKPNEFMIQFIEHAIKNENKLDSAAKANLAILKIAIDKIRFIEKYNNQQHNNNNNDIDAVTLLREIHSAHPSFLLDEKLSFNIDTVLKTVEYDLDIVLFYLRNKTLCEPWFSSEENKTKLYQLAVQHSLVEFTLFDCYKHLTKLDRDAFNKLKFAGVSSNQLSSSALGVVMTDPANAAILPPGPPPPPPPAAAPPPPPPPGPPPAAPLPAPGLPFKVGPANAKAPANNNTKSSNGGSTQLEMRDVAARKKLEKNIEKLRQAFFDNENLTSLGSFVVSKFNLSCATQADIEKIKPEFIETFSELIDDIKGDMSRAEKAKFLEFFFTDDDKKPNDGIRRFTNSEFKAVLKNMTQKEREDFAEKMGTYCKTAKEPSVKMSTSNDKKSTTPNPEMLRMQKLAQSKLASFLFENDSISALGQVMIKIFNLPCTAQNEINKISYDFIKEINTFIINIKIIEESKIIEKIDAEINSKSKSELKKFLSQTSQADKEKFAQELMSHLKKEKEKLEKSRLEKEKLKQQKEKEKQGNIVKTNDNVTPIKKQSVALVTKILDAISTLSPIDQEQFKTMANKSIDQLISKSLSLLVLGSETITAHTNPEKRNVLLAIFIVFIAAKEQHSNQVLDKNAFINDNIDDECILFLLSDGKKASVDLSTYTLPTKNMIYENMLDVYRALKANEKSSMESNSMTVGEKLRSLIRENAINAAVDHSGSMSSYYITNANNLEDSGFFSKADLEAIVEKNTDKNTDKLEKLEEHILGFINKLNRGMKVYKEENTHAMYSTLKSSQSLEEFSTACEEKIWQPLKAYAEKIGKPQLLIKTRAVVLGLSAFSNNNNTPPSPPPPTPGLGSAKPN